MDTLPLLATLAPGTRFQPLVFPVNEGWWRYNPSIARSEGGFTCIVRLSTATRVDGRFVISTGGFPVRSENSLAILDDDLRLQTVHRLRDKAVLGPRQSTHFLGWEDLRLVSAPDGWLATATTREYNPNDINQQALVQIRGHSITGGILLSTPEAGHQKNWMPVLGAPLLTLVTDCWPTTVIRIDAERGVRETIAERPAPDIARHFRGGSHLAPVGDGYLCVVHELVHRRGVSRLYAHRLVHFTTAFQIDAVSTQFAFQVMGVEFCAGLAHHDGRFVLSFGVNDAEAWLATVPEQELLDLLLPVREGTPREQTRGPAATA